MKVKEILNMEAEELQRMMTDEEFYRMKDLGFQYTWELLEMMQDGAKQCDEEEMDEEYTTISEYLDYVEEMRG